MKWLTPHETWNCYPGMLLGAHLKEIAGVSIHKKKRVGDFPGTCALFSQKNFIFHSLPPCTSLVHVCNSSVAISKLCSPSSLKLSPSDYLKRKRLYGEKGNFLKCLLFLYARGIVNLRNSLNISPDDSVQL